MKKLISLIVAVILLAGMMSIVMSADVAYLADRLGELVAHFEFRHNLRPHLCPIRHSVRTNNLHSHFFLFFPPFRLLLPNESLYKLHDYC